MIVIGGGDTGADCVASAHREGAASVTQIELLGEPPAHRPDDLTPWPLWPMKLRTSYALKEGGERSFAVSTTGLLGRRTASSGSTGCRTAACRRSTPVPGTEESRPADLVLLAMGFLGPEQQLLEALGVERDERGNAAAPAFATSVPGVFAAGDARRGQSLIVWAIDEGRRCARAVDAWLAPNGRPSRPSARRRRVVKPGPRDGFRWNRETIVYAFELWNRRHLCSPTVDEWRRAGRDHPSVRTVRSAFGSWNRGVKAAGLRPRRPGEARGGPPLAGGSRRPRAVTRWSRHATSSDAAWAHEHGRQPSLEQWRRAGRAIPRPRRCAGCSAAGTRRSSRPASSCARPASRSSRGA